MNLPYTPGPWFVNRTSEPKENGEYSLLIKPVPGQVICELDPLPNESANAILIASAPDLLHTIEGSHSFFTALYDRLVNAGEEEEVLSEISLTLEAMTTVINKAKGIGDNPRIW